MFVFRKIKQVNRELTLLCHKPTPYSLVVVVFTSSQMTTEIICCCTLLNKNVIVLVEYLSDNK